jgi:hypothetical protein
MLVKLFSPSPEGERRYSPAQRTLKLRIEGNPDPKHVICRAEQPERQNAQQEGNQAATCHPFQVTKRSDRPRFGRETLS